MSDQIVATLHLTAEHAAILAHCLRLGIDEAGHLVINAENSGVMGAAAINHERRIAMQAMLEGLFIQAGTSDLHLLAIESRGDENER